MGVNMKIGKQITGWYNEKVDRNYHSLAMCGSCTRLKASASPSSL